MLTQNELSILMADLQSRLAEVHEGGPFAVHIGNTNLKGIARYYNSVAVPKVDIWKPDLTIDEITNVIVMSDFIAITAARREAWMAMSQATFINATLAQVRANFVSIFGNNTATTNAVTAIAKRPATRFEALFITGEASSRYGYQVVAEDIETAIRL